MTTFSGDIKKIKKNGVFAEQVIAVKDSVFLSVDIAACEKDLSLSVAVKDNTKDETFVILGEAMVPSGAFLSFFVRKMVSNKTIIIRTTEDAVIWIEQEKVI